MTVPVARRNLFSEKGRFAISVAGVAFAVLLILIVLALYRGWSKTGETFQQLPGQLWVVQEGTSDPFHSVSLIELDELKALSSTSGVRAVVPVMSRQMTFRAAGGEQSARLMALDFGPIAPVDSELKERFLPQRGTMIIDSTLSRKAGLDEGDVATFGATPLTVAHVGPRSSEVLSPFVFVNFEDAATIFGVSDVVSYGMVILTEDAVVTDVRSNIEAQNPGLQVFTAEEFAKSIRKEIDESFIPVIAILVAIGFVVGAAVVGLTIYTATIERTREFGVMKAVGGSPAFLYRIVLSQSAILTGGGYLVGLAGALVVARLAERVVPEFATNFELRDVGFVLGASLLMALVASLVPVNRVVSIDPASVFRA